MSDLMLSRRHLLGVGASAAMMASQGSGPVLAETTGSIPSRSGLAWASGVRAVDPDAFVALRQRPIDVLVTYSKKETWAEIRGSGNYNYKSLLGPRQNRQEVIVVSYPLFPVEQNPRDHGADLWRRAANGEFDMHHDAAAATFAPYPQTLIFRPGWEWNVAGFAPWSCTDVALAADYVTYFRRVVDRLRAHRPNCRIDWCSGKKGRTNASIDRWYPGQDWVDFVGHDKYDWWLPTRNQTEWDTDYNSLWQGGPRGIGSWLAYARSKGKKLTVPEWGIVNGQDGGGDNSYFVQRMYHFFRINAAELGYECYFNKDIRHRLEDNVAARKKYLWLY